MVSFSMPPTTSRTSALLNGVADVTPTNAATSSGALKLKLPATTDAPVSNVTLKVESVQVEIEMEIEMPVPQPPLRRPMNEGSMMSKPGECIVDQRIAPSRCGPKARRSTRRRPSPCSRYSMPMQPAAPQRQRSVPSWWVSP